MSAAAAAAAAPARSVEDDELLQRELRERVQRLRVSRADVRDQAARAAKTLCTDILAGLKQEQRYPRSFNWRMSNSGSYFDRTKVRFSWWLGTVVGRRSLPGELFLSCTRPAADG